MGVHLQHRKRAMAPSAGAQRGQGDGMVASHQERNGLRGEDGAGGKLSTALRTLVASKGGNTTFPLSTGLRRSKVLTMRCTG